MPTGIASVAGLSMFKMRSPANNTMLGQQSSQYTASSAMKGVYFINKRTKNRSQVCGDGKREMKQRLGWSRRNLRASCVRVYLGKTFDRAHLEKHREHL